MSNVALEFLDGKSSFAAARQHHAQLYRDRSWYWEQWNKCQWSWCRQGPPPPIQRAAVMFQIPSRPGTFGATWLRSASEKNEQSQLKADSNVKLKISFLELFCHRLISCGEILFDFLMIKIFWVRTPLFLLWSFNSPSQSIGEFLAAKELLVIT